MEDKMDSSPILKYNNISKMHCYCPTPLLLISFIMVTIAMINSANADQNADNERRSAPVEQPRHRRAFGALLGLSGFATKMGCQLFPTKVCPTLMKIPFFGRKRRNAEADTLLPVADVGALVENTTAELKKVAETEGFAELSEADQEEKLLESVDNVEQGTFVKEQLKDAIDEAEKTVDKSLDRIVMYSEVPAEAKLAMKQVFKTITDETKTPKQKVDKIKQLEDKWSTDLKESLKPNMDEKAIDEAAHFFSNVPQQIALVEQK